MSGTPTTITGAQIRDGSVSRTDLNTTVTGQAVLTKVVASSNMSFTSTGVDAGTGDVTIDLTNTSITPGTYTKLVIDVKGRATASGGALLATDLPTSGVTAGQYTKVTVDGYGRATAGTSLAAGDIPSGSTFYVQNQAASPQTGSNWVSGFVGALEHRAYNAAGTFYTSWAAPTLAASYTFKMPDSYGAANQHLTGDGAGNLSWSNAGTVTSVQVAAPAQFNVTGGPVTGAGTITLAWAAQTANQVLAAPNGISGTPTFRALLSSDIPSLPASIITSGVFPPSMLGSGTTNNTTFLRGDGTWVVAGGTVTSVGLDLPSIFTVTMSPVTTSGTLTATLASQSANTVLSAPNGSAGAPTFRTLVAADIPNLTSTYLPLAGGGMSGALTLAAATTATAGLIVTPGTAPTTPVNGSIWTTSAGLYVQINALTKTVNTSAATVSSVGLSAPAELTVTGSPVTTSGTLSMVWTSQAANTFLGAPNGAPGTPSFRVLAPADIPAGSTAYIQNQSAAAQATSNGWVSGFLAASSFKATNSTFSVTVAAPTLASNWSLTLPTGAGTAGFSLVTDGNGVTSWVASPWVRSGTQVNLSTATDKVTIGDTTNNLGALGVSTGSVRLKVDSSVKALLHFDGANSSRTIVDLAGNTWVTSRTATLSTSVFKFGVSALSFNGTSSYAVCTNPGNDFAFGTGDFTVDFFVYFSAVTLTRTLVDLGGSTSGMRISYVAGTGIQVIVAGTTFAFSFTPTVSTWYHVAVTRSSSSLRVFSNGTQIGTTQASTGAVGGVANLAVIGATNTQGTAAATNFFSGYMDELRILNVAAWIANFTAPTAAYDYQGLVQWGTSVTQETGMVMVADALGRVGFRQPPKVAIAEFCLGEFVSNTSQYFYTGRSLGSTQDANQRSGNSAGLANANACSPWLCPFNGRVTKAVLTLSKAGVNNGSVTYPCMYNVRLYRVGWAAAQDPNTNGGVANNLQFPLWSGVNTYSVGVVSANIELENLNIPVASGDMLALQFVNGTGASAVAMTTMAFVGLVIEELG